MLQTAKVSRIKIASSCLDFTHLNSLKPITTKKQITIVLGLVCVVLTKRMKLIASIVLKFDVKNN